MDSRPKIKPSEIEEFPDYGDFPDVDTIKSSRGKLIPSDGPMVQIEYKAPEGFKYEFGYDKERGRSGYLLVPLEKHNEAKEELMDEPDDSKQWQFGDEIEPFFFNG